MTWHQHKRSNFQQPGGCRVISQVSTGIYQVYACHMSSATWASAAALLRACRVFQAAFAASPLHLLRIFCVAATERPATRGCGLPKFHSQVLTSYTWLPLRDPWRGLSAQPNSKSRPCRAAYLWGMVEVRLPSRKHGESGTRPRTSSTLPT
jgi:hypothetical protein